MMGVPAVGEEAQRQVELAGAAVAAFDVDAAVAHLSAAVRGFTAAGDNCNAAVACARLGDLYAIYLGNLAAGRAWFTRASRLVADEPPCLEQGWVAVAPMGCDVDDPAELLARAELALDRARRFGDVNLETKAMADAGLAQVLVGRVTEGMALLDEAMALACGPADDIDVVGKSVCSFFTACYFAVDFARADSWAGVLRQHGLIGITPGVPIYLGNHCDSLQATLLCELGQWGEAEALLTRAIAEFEAVLPLSSWHPAIALADLRIRQGRLVDAEMLLLGKDDHLQALLPMARLHLARGDHDLARATAARGLRTISVDRLRAAELLAVLVDVELAVGDVEAAAASSADLDARTRGLDCPVLLARTAAARARTLAASGDLADAIEAVEKAVDVLSDAATPWLRATLHIDLARLRERAGHAAAARVAAKAAAAMLTGLDVVLPAADRALLGRWVGVSALGSPAPQLASLTREDRWWAAACGDVRVRLPDTKGMRYLGELVANPGVERHALDLVDRIEGVPPVAGAIADRRHLGDAGELIDGQARAAYRRRIEALRTDVADALESGLEDRAEALQGELDQLVAQLASAFGLGGRARRAASAAERARLNVTRALRAATTKLTEALPGPGAVLDHRVHTGRYCVYQPAPDDTVRWVVHPGVNDPASD
jgi:tetratricopeptide (TPR) repeat protein